MEHVDPAVLKANGLVLLPKLDVKASAGSGIIPHGESIVGFSAFEEALLRSMGVNPRFAHLLQISGDSMFPTLTSGEWVVVDVSINHVQDDALYAVVFGGFVLVKRLQIMFDGGLTLSSDNKAAGYKDHIIPPHDLPDFRAVGRVMTHMRRT